MQNQLSNYVMWTLNIQVLIISILLILVGAKVIEYRSKKLTRSVRRLYETLKVVADKMEDDETVVTPNVLSFYEHNHEINELHRTFNSIVKTMVLAHQPDQD